jgi:hypothetical protein
VTVATLEEITRHHDDVTAGTGRFVPDGGHGFGVRGVSGCPLGRLPQLARRDTVTARGGRGRRTYASAMTTQDLGQDLGHGLGQDLGHGLGQDLGQDLHPRSAVDSEPEQGALGALFDSSPALPAHVSAAAEVAFVAGLLAAMTVPFSLTMALCLGLAAVGLVTSVVGMARSSRPGVAGGLLASVGLVLSLATVALVGLRYAGIDTTVGDDALPTIADWLTTLNDLVPSP